MRARAAAFLDRDGVLNRRPRQHDYVRAVEDLDLLPGVADAVGELGRAGFVPIVVSNQRGVARGLVTEQVLRGIESAIRAAGAPVEAFYYCPHDVEDGCDCRKPQPGLLVRASAEHNLSLRASVMIGDSESDVAAGTAAGCHTVRIGDRDVMTAADAVAESLPDATALVVARWEARPGGVSRP